jgi:hypothetical protein
MLDEDPIVHEVENIYKYCIIIMTTTYYGYKNQTGSKKSDMVVDPFEEEKLRRKCGSVKERDRW